MIKQRSFALMIVLSIITCGIYGIIFWYQYAEDLNRVCAGDGKNTMNYIIVFLLNFVTCGIFGLVWMYGIGNRLQENAPRYGFQFTENGTTVLLWYIFGSLLCFIGYFYSQYILVKNMNALADRYNQQYNGGGYQQQSYQQPPYNNY